MLKTRIVTALVMAVVFVICVIALPTSMVALLLALVVLLAAWEWTGLCKFAPAFNWVFYLAISILLALSYFYSQLVASWILWLSFLWWTGVFVAILKYKQQLDNSPQAVAASKFLIGLIVLVPAWWALVSLHQKDSYAGWFLYLFLLVWFADTGAYFAGKFFGKHKLAPLISPGKTIEGLAGGLAAVLLLSCAWLFIYPVESKQLTFVVLSLVTALFSVVGDLFESLLKRQAKVKDSSALLPGHGGILDRVDSVLAAAPIFVLGMMVFAIN